MKDPASQSSKTAPFVKELMKSCPEVTVRDGMRPRCPMCGRGALVPSQSGDNLRCSNFPRCQHMTPRCPGCGRGYVSLKGGRSGVFEPGVRVAAGSMPQVLGGVLLLRSGRSKFWGVISDNCRCRPVGRRPCQSE